MGIREILSRRKRRSLRKKLKLQEKLNLEIRDNLAMERTKLANERTFLSYTRTAMAMILGGLTFIKFFDDPFYIILGIMSIPLGVSIGFYGYIRFARKKGDISRHTHAYAPTSPVLAETAADEDDEEADEQELKG